MSDDVKCEMCDAQFEDRSALMEHGQVVHSMSHPDLRDEAQRISPSRLLDWGALGGFVGGIAMGIVMMITGAMAMGNATVMMSAIGAALFGLPPTATTTALAGLVVHLFSSTLIGIVLAGTLYGASRASPRFRRALFVTGPKKGIGAGVLAGVVVFLIFGLPMMMFVVVPELVKISTDMMAMNPMYAGMPMSMLTAKAQSMLNSMMGGLLAAFFVAHIIYGIVLGVLVAYGVKRHLGSLPAGHPTATSRPV